MCMGVQNNVTASTQGVTPIRTVFSTVTSESSRLLVDFFFQEETTLLVAGLTLTLWIHTIHQLLIRSHSKATYTCRQLATMLFKSSKQWQPKEDKILQCS